MDCALLKQHVQHFSQADGILPIRKPFIEFRKYAEVPLGEAFHNGKVDIDEMNADCYIKELSEELQYQPSDSPCIPTELRAKD
eukprot:13679567-Ditylum_brightwellii.AAC.1